MRRCTSSNSCFGIDRSELLLREKAAMRNEGLIRVLDSVHPHSGDRNEVEVERIVRKTLLQMQDICRFENVDTIMGLVVPKVLYDLHAIEHLTMEVQAMKESLNSYIHYSKVMGEDIAEIFLDLHNIYTKIDQLDRNPPRKPRERRDKLCKRLREAEHFLENAKHFITKGKKPLPTTTPTITPTSTPTVTPTATPTATPTSSMHKQRKQERLSDAARQTRYAEKRAFLTNMIMVKKSDFSMELNRNKNYYPEAERALKKRDGNKHRLP